MELREKLAERNISTHQEGGAEAALSSRQTETEGEPLEAVSGLTSEDIDGLMGTNETSLGATGSYGNGAQITDLAEELVDSDDEDDEDWPDDEDGEEE